MATAPSQEVHVATAPSREVDVATALRREVHVAKLRVSGGASEELMAAIHDKYWPYLTELSLDPDFRSLHRQKLFSTKMTQVFLDILKRTPVLRKLVIYNPIVFVRLERPIPVEIARVLDVSDFMILAASVRDSCKKFPVG
eukprot:722115_1